MEGIVTNSLRDLIERAELLGSAADDLRGRIGDVAEDKTLTSDLDFELSQIVLRTHTICRTLRLAQALAGSPVPEIRGAA